MNGKTPVFSVSEMRRLTGVDNTRSDIDASGLLSDAGNATPAEDVQPEYGPIETALRNDIRALRLTGQLSDTVVNVAYALAAKLDGDAGLATAAVARELAKYVELIEGAAGDDEDTRDHRDELSTPV